MPSASVKSKRSKGAPTRASSVGKATVVRTAGGVYVNGVRGSALVGKYLLVIVQPAPGEPKHFTREQISAVVARHMKLA